MLMFCLCFTYFLTAFLFAIENSPWWLLKTRASHFHLGFEMELANPKIKKNGESEEETEEEAGEVCTCI